MLAVILAIILLIVIVYYLYKTKYQEKVPHVTYTEEKMELIDKSLYHKGIIFDYDPHIPIQMTSFSKNDEYCMEPYELKYNEAIVVYGYIPSRYIYWGLTGYICDYWDEKRKVFFRPVCDSVSSKYIYSASNTHIVVVLTYNQNLYEEIQKLIISELQSSGYLCMIYPLYIPKEYLLNKARFTIINETIINNHEEQIPNWGCRFYQSKNIRPKLPLIKTPTSEEKFVSENEILSKEKWEQSCCDLVKTYVKKINTYSLINTFTSNDVTCIDSSIISLKENEALFIVSVDHAKFGKSIYSYISINDIKCNYTYKHIVTGNIKDLRSKISNKRLTLRFIYHCPQEHIKKIRVKECVYIHPGSYYAPDLDSFLPMQIFIVKKNIAQEYEFTKFEK